MRMIDKLRQEHPEFIGEQFPGGTAVCPDDVGYENSSTTCKGTKLDPASKEYIELCRRCWEREMKE